MQSGKTAPLPESVQIRRAAGQTSDLIKTAAENAGMDKITVCINFEEAVLCAKNVSENGDIVLLSPACASCDLFKNFEVRGNTFKKLVMEL